MSAPEGLRIISIVKSLEAFQRGDQNISRYFGATVLAGHAGLLLASLRKHRRMSWRKLQVLAATCHIDVPTLAGIVEPWMLQGAFIDKAQTGENPDVVCNVLDYTAIFEATSTLFHSANPTPEERALLALLDLGIQLPRTKSEVFRHPALTDEETVDRALGLAKAYKVLGVLEGKSVGEPMIYSPLIWGKQIGKAGRALSHLEDDKRQVLLQLVEMVREYQGFPVPHALQWLRAQDHPELLDFAARVGLVERTAIAVTGGHEREFLTTPHVYGELAAIQGQDVCDKVRLFLDSIRHGQHYGEWYTGRINDPVKLLTKLIDAGEIGPCTAIGRDYQLVEKAGIVNVRPSAKPGQFVMQAVQDDTVALVRDIVAQKLSVGHMDFVPGACGQDAFFSAEHMRAGLGDPPQKVREAQEEILRSLREM